MSEDQLRSNATKVTKSPKKAVAGKRATATKRAPPAKTIKRK